MLIATIITFDDFPLIKECVDSLISKVDKIIIVDGKFGDFPGESNYSTDGTLEYLKDKVSITLIGGFDEVDKRNMYLNQLNDGDICLNLDADEVLIGNIPELKSDFGIIDLHDGHSKHIQRRATRFFKFREGMHYENVHYTLYFNGKIINRLHEVINKEFSFEYVKDFYILHNWHKRDDLRKYNKSIYYKKLIKKEAGFVK